MKFWQDVKVYSKDRIDEKPVEKESFVLTGDFDGTPSEWYDKWYNTSFLPVISKKMSTREAAKEGYTDRAKYEWIYDIEVFKEDWLFVAKTVDKQNKIICWNDPKSLAKWISNKILIGFNNAAYDNPVISYAMSYDEIKAKNPDALTVKEFSDKLIHEETNYFAEAKNVNATHFLSWDISFHEKYDIRSLSQLKQWSIQYNNDELKTKSRKRVRKMGRKVSFEEKCKIVQWVLDHDNDYQGATIQFNVSYQRVYSWVRKYHEAADSWEALKDNRGHRKPQKALEEMTEKERLEAEIKRLKKINREMELEIAFAKKLVEIRNRGEATGRYQAVQELINETAGSVSELTKIAKVSRKAYYQWLKDSQHKEKLRTRQFWKQSIRLKNAIRTVLVIKK